MSTRLPQSSVSYLIQHELGAAYRSDEFNEILLCCAKYTLGCYASIKDFHSAIEAIWDFDETEYTPSKFRLMLCSNAAAMYNMKFYLLNLLRVRGLDGKIAARLSKDFGMFREDALVLFKLLVPKMRTELRKTSLPYKTQKPALYSLEEFEQVPVRFQEIFPALQKTASITVRAKLSYILKAQNLTAQELRNDLLADALKAYYTSLPNEFELEHQLNYLRRTIINRAANMHDTYGAGKRKRMFDESTGKERKFTIKIMSENQLGTGADGEEMSYENMASSDYRVKSEGIRDLDFSVNQLVEKHSGTKKEHVIKILVGREVPKFTTWLKTKRLLRSDSKSGADWTDGKTQAEIVEAVAGYLDVSEKSIYNFLPKLGKQLGVM